MQCSLMILSRGINSYQLVHLNIVYIRKESDISKDECIFSALPRSSFQFSIFIFLLPFILFIQLFVFCAFFHFTKMFYN